MRLDPERLLYMYVRKEAALTSQLEGSQSTLSELLEHENEQAPGTPLDAVRELIALRRRAANRRTSRRMKR